MGSRSKGKHGEGRSWLVPALAIGAVVVVGAGASGAVLLARNGNTAGTRSPGGATARHTGSHGAGSSSTGGGGSGSHGSGAPAGGGGALQVVSISPRSGAAGVGSRPTITIQLSAPLSAGSAYPQISPAVPGNWVRAAPNTLEFNAAANFPPYTTVKVTVPAGTRDSAGGTLLASFQSRFTIQPGSTLRLQQLLAELGYLPVNFMSSSNGAQVNELSTGATTTTAAPTTTTSPSESLDSEPATAGQISLSPQSGTFAWRWAGTPASLRSLWTPGAWNVPTRGAVMAFEAAEGLGVDGDPGPLVWRTLLSAVAARQMDPNPYDYIWVSEKLPETLYVWQDGRTLFHVLANTGIAQAPTATGTYPVYVRYAVTTMSGTNPNGTHYSDPGIPWVAYFNGGDAIHGFWRSTYGWPQSLGCVELVPNDAHRVWPYDQLGTLVTVTA